MVAIKLKREYVSLILILCCIFLIFKYPEAVKNGVNEGLNICLYTIIPSLFPFMVLSTYVVKSDILSPVYKLFSAPVRLIFHQPTSAISVILLSMIGGFPVGIKMTNDLFMKGKINKEQAQRLCLFCMNAGPAFVITAVGTNMLRSTKAGIIIYSSLCISSFISGIITSFVVENEEKKLKSRNEKSLKLTSLSASVTDSIQAIFGICAWVILFSAITMCIKEFKFPEKAHIYITSFFEVTKGCLVLVGNSPLPIITGIIGFGGICVHCQVLEHLKNIELKYSCFFVSRILNGILSGIISHLLLLLFPVEIDVFSNTDKISSYSFSFSYSAFFVVIIMCVVMIFDIDRKKNYDRMN